MCEYNKYRTTKMRRQSNSSDGKMKTEKKQKMKIYRTNWVKKRLSTDMGRIYHSIEGKWVKLELNNILNITKVIEKK